MTGTPDTILSYLRQTLPPEIAALAEPYMSKLELGEYEPLLSSPEARTLFGHDNDSKTEAVKIEDFPSWNDFVFHRLGVLLADRRKPEGQSVYFCIGYAALLAFLQSNVTGPPLGFSSAETVFTKDVSANREAVKSIRSTLLEGLGVDGIAAYQLTPNIELLCLADAIFTTPPILKHIKPARWAKLRTQFIQQRLLSEVSSTLQNVIYEDLELLQDEIVSTSNISGRGGDMMSEFLLERATIHTHHGLDKLAREDLNGAKRERHFDFALTGLLGKRTKYQQKETSQLVVLARSHADEGDSSKAEPAGQIKQSISNGISKASVEESRPANLDLNDDTLLEAISFAQPSTDSIQITDEANLPVSLSSLDPSNQPQLDPLDATILLDLASSIKNTSPEDGLTREETLPYATRVLEGGSSNWQVYTQALLIRSRIEGYKSRTVERGLLQLQALVDQVIADTAGVETAGTDKTSEQANSFLPKAKESESAGANDRLRYIFQLASPNRWDLEAELASRWVSLGGLRSALEIYERLEMWAEAALCWAATEREDKARKVVRRQLFHASNGGPQTDDSEMNEDENWSGPPRLPAPQDAPRLYCILGDIDQSPEMYEKAWEVSNHRYARAQRSLGRYYLAAKDFVKAADAYSKSLKANQLNHGSWFALGCALLELAQFEKAAEAFSRCVQLDENDAESWSNLAAALLRRELEVEEAKDTNGTHDNNLDDSEEETVEFKAQKQRQDALKALKRAATLKHDSYRIWQNVLIVSASISPPDYNSILAAQKKIIDLRGSVEGEQCIDLEILDLLIQHVISLSDEYDSSRPGLQRMAVKFIDENVVPLITSSANMWRLISKLALWRGKPSSALDAEEKAWRAITSQPGWENESESHWNDVVEATVRLCDSYESLGQRERTEGMGAGEPVAKDWKFKARTAVRGIMGKGRGSWDGTDGWEKLKQALDNLKGA